MKLKLISLVALSAILSLASCSKKNNATDTEIEGNDREIILRMELPNSTNTRASIEAPITSVTAIVQTLDIYFYNVASGQIFSVTNLDAGQITQITSENGLAFDALDVLVDAVAVVANNTVTKDVSAAVNQNISVLQGKSLNISLEQNFSNVTFYGKDETLIAYTPASPEANVDYFYASVVIKPLVSRIEVSGISCTNIGAIIQTLQLNSVFTDNSYQNIGMETEIFTDLFTSTEASVLTDPTNWWINPSLTQAITATPYSPQVGGADGVFAFHFIPSTLAPTIRLRLQTLFAQGADEPRYVNVRGFRLADGSSLTTFEPGNIYKMTVPFAEENCMPFDDTTREVTVTVTVQPWTIVDGIVPAL